VERVRDPDDRRRWELRPRADRQTEIAARFAPLTEAIVGLCADDGGEELDVVIGFLTNLGTILDGQTERLRQGAGNGAASTAAARDTAPPEG
jgi:DNA-binding MarR family transcriptional regulator